MTARLFAAALLIAAAAPAGAQSQPMTAGEFLAQAEPLMKKSKASLIFSGKARNLLRILGDAAQRNRASLEAERAAGRRVPACLPPTGKARVDANELIAYLRALPPAQRAQSFDSAFAGYVAKKYPCRT